MSTAATNKKDEKTLTEDFKTQLQRVPLRIEFSIAFTPKGSVETATLYTKGDRGRWVSDLPFIAAHEGANRGDLLQVLGDAYRDAVGEPRSTLAFEEAQTAGGDTVWHVFDRIQQPHEDRILLGVIREVEGQRVFATEVARHRHDWTPIELEHLAIYLRNR